LSAHFVGRYQLLTRSEISTTCLADAGATKKTCDRDRPGGLIDEEADPACHVFGALFRR
jgi:hypothetical protein